MKYSQGKGIRMGNNLIVCIDFLSVETNISGQIEILINT